MLFPKHPIPFYKYDNNNMSAKFVQVKYGYN